MRNFIEKIFILIFCLYNTYHVDRSEDLVPFFLICIIISFALDLFKTKKAKILLYFLFLSLVFYDNIFISYLPLILYNLYLDFKQYSLFSLLLLWMNFSTTNFLLSLISLYLSKQTSEFNIFLEENKETRDRLKEDTLYLKKYNDQLEIDKEKNIEIAILTERNRIAREIHDSIGHSISSGILQVEALKVISEKDKFDNLNLLQNTLSDGMNDIRNSIHNLYNESLDLEKRIQKICSEASSLNINLKYSLDEDLSFDLKFDILSIVRESITNCIKHSDASKLKISLLSQPKFHSISIKDNGSPSENHSNLLKEGIGLLSMEDIARKHKGFLNYEYSDGFKIYITLMKG